MADLTEFLAARLDEDEQLAQQAVPGPWNLQGVPRETLVFSEPTSVTVAVGWARDLEHIARHDPARVLREVEAKRRIVDLHAPVDGYCTYCLESESDIYGRTYAQSPCMDLRLLALPYADHPEFEEEWKP